MKNSHSKRDFIVGISYDSEEEDKGHFAIRRKVTMEELISELSGFMKSGHHHPTFPSRANPTVQYAWDLSAKDDGDCYGEIINELDKIILQ
jgi:hypothetical protein